MATREGIRRRPTVDEAGFTGVEVLTVLVVLTLLFAIAVPAFFHHRDKARDAQAKADARAAQTAALQIGQENDGRSRAPGGITAANLRARDSTLENADLSVPFVLGRTYTVRVQSETGNTFDITSYGDAGVDLTCASADDAGCPADGTWD